MEGPEQFPFHKESRLLSGVVAGQNELITVPSGQVELGKAQQIPSYGWDNEYGHVTVRYSLHVQFHLSCTVHFKCIATKVIFPIDHSLLLEMPFVQCSRI